MPIVQGRQKMRNVYAARTVPEQKGFGTLTRVMQSYIGRAANILGPTKTHMTFMESYGVKQKLVQYGYGPRELVVFAGGLERYLDKRGHSIAIKARVDQDSPLRWMPRHGNVRMLALNFERSEQLLDARGSVEEYLVNQLGVLPQITPFAPHVTFGKISGAYVTPEMRRDPTLLLPRHARIPHYVALNGLHVYLDRIHEVEHPLAAPDPTIGSSVADMAETTA